MKLILTFIAALSAAPAFADVAEVVDQHILPGYAAFTDAARTLSDAADADCTPEAVRPAWNAAFDAWLGVSHIQFGPVQDAGQNVAIAFWPDERSAGPRALAALIANNDPIIAEPGGTTRLSVGARGLFGLEYLLFDPQFTDAGPYGCDLIRALSADLLQMAAGTQGAWEDNYANLLRTAGDAGNAIFLTSEEGTQILFTSLLSGLEFASDKRLGRPMGTFDRPRPTRAESWRSVRSLHNVDLSLQALRDLTVTLTENDAPRTMAAFDRALDLVAALDDPDLSGVSDPQGRFKVEIIQQAVDAIQAAALTEIGAQLGVSAGFNSADGD